MSHGIYRSLDVPPHLTTQPDPPVVMFLLLFFFTIYNNGSAEYNIHTRCHYVLGGALTIFRFANSDRLQQRAPLRVYRPRKYFRNPKLNFKKKTPLPTFVRKCRRLFFVLFLCVFRGHFESLRFVRTPPSGRTFARTPVEIDSRHELAKRSNGIGRNPADETGSIKRRYVRASRPMSRDPVVGFRHDRTRTRAKKYRVIDRGVFFFF